MNLSRRQSLATFGSALSAAFIPWHGQAQSGLPPLLGYLRTNWSRDPYSLGSYSYVPVGVRRGEHRELGRHENNKLFFAGEAAHPERNSTVHAAHESGLRAAGQILQTSARRVAIVGAGMAGLSAAKRLSERGLEVKLYEARNRLGGRVWTRDDLGAPLDMGASWIHGTRRNPLTGLARQVGAQTVSTDESYQIWSEGRQISDDEAPDWLDSKGSEITFGIHFMSATVHDFSELEVGADHRLGLLIEVSADGCSKEVVRGLAEILERPIDTGYDVTLAELIRVHCRHGQRDDLQRILNRHQIRNGPLSIRSDGLKFEGTPGLSVQRIRAESILARAALRGIRRTQPKDLPLHRIEALRQELSKNPMLRAAMDLPVSEMGQAALKELRLGEAPAISRAFWHKIYALIIGLAGLVWLIQHAAPWLFVGLAILFGWAFISILRQEELDPHEDVFIDNQQYRAIAGRENRTANNHMTVVTTLKPGLMPMLLLRLAFFGVGLMARSGFKPGHLYTLRTIHFARWARVPGTKQLLFLSNYSGSWEAYLEDFVTKSPVGLNAVWANCVGYPRTRFRFRGGAAQGDPFKRWARRHQVPTLFWYSAYPDLTSKDITRNTTIQALINQAVTPGEARELLHMLGETPAPETILEKSEIQSLVFGGLGRYQASRTLTLDLRALRRYDRAESFFDFLLRHVAYGEVAYGPFRCQLAFTHEGLKHLGLFDQHSVCQTHRFSPAFEDGMDSVARAAILGDNQDPARPNWIWGNKDNPGHVLVLCYAKNESEAKWFEGGVRSRARAAGIGVSHRLVTSLPTPQHAPGQTREPFGFRDGISQPLIDGSARAARMADPANTLAPGEFILGYLDGRKMRPASPGVPADYDVRNLLPAFRGEGQARFHDFGRNGSYLVVRQLQQDVVAFNTYCMLAARRARKQGYGEVDTAWIKAKMIGRWPDGRSLVRHPDRPVESLFDPAKIDADFSFYKEDPQGLACPMGAHVRRANPRDSFADEGDIGTQIDINNRRRILRVGRPYGLGPIDTAEPDEGLLFMCLNGDIERQFEFVQQSWLGLDSFNDLPGEVDPISHRVGRRGRRFTIQHPRGSLELKSMPQFVSVRGGGYFFLPSKSALAYLRDQIRTI